MQSDIHSRESVLWSIYMANVWHFDLSMNVYNIKYGASHYLYYGLIDLKSNRSSQTGIVL